MAAMSIVFAEDSYIVREGVGLLLARVENLHLVATCRTYDELLSAVARHRPQVVITDIQMPPTRTDEGVRAALEIRSRWPGTGVVVLSQYLEPSYVLSLFEHGTTGLAYLLKERLGDLQQLVAAIDQVRRAGSVVDPTVVEVLVGARARGSKLDRLTPRELEVLALVAEGRTNAGVAHALHLSERAIEKHVNSIFTKLDLGFEEEVNKRVRAVVVWLAEH